MATNVTIRDVPDELAARAALAGRSRQEHLRALRIELFAYEPVAERVWELRGAVTAADAISERG